MDSKAVFALISSAQQSIDIAENISSVYSCSEKAAKAGANILVFPEMHLTSYLLSEEDLKTKALSLDQVLLSFSDLVKDLNICLVISFAEVFSSRFYVSSIALSPEGLLAHYRKIHLGPPEKILYTPGSCPSYFSFKGFNISLALCYDAHFPELFTFYRAKGVDIFLLPHASPRGSSELKKNSWLRHLPARAYDNAAYLFAVNPCGNDGGGRFFPGLALVFGPDGYLQAELLTEEPDFLLYTPDLEFLSRLRSNFRMAFYADRKEELYKTWLASF